MSQAKFTQANHLFILLRFERLERVAVGDVQVGGFSSPLFSSGLLSTMKMFCISPAHARRAMPPAEGRFINRFLTSVKPFNLQLRLLEAILPII